MPNMADELLRVQTEGRPTSGSGHSRGSSASSNGSHKNKELLKSYHDLAAHLFHDGKTPDTDTQFLMAARDGNYEKVSEFLHRMSQEYINIDGKDERTGNTPIIWAAKRGHTKIVQILLKYGADITLRNYDNECALEVASNSIRHILLDSVERTGCTPRHLLQAAWQGNVKVLRRLLSESKMLDINCRNADGYTPLLLVTRDIDLFEKIGTIVKGYNPAEVVSILVRTRADVSASDLEGKTPVHFLSGSRSKISGGMVSMLLKDCPVVDSRDTRSFAPIHSASQSGQANIVVALIGRGADVNCRGFAGATPLHVSASSGHEKVATTLLEHGADILLVDDSGNTAVDVAKTKKVKSTLKEAWAEAAEAKRDSISLSPVKPPSRASMLQSFDESFILSPTPTQFTRKRMSEVIFDVDDLPHGDYPSPRNISPGKKKMIKRLSDAEKANRAEIKMMQEIENGRFTPRPNPRKLGMSRACSRCDSRNSMVITPMTSTPVIPPGSPNSPEKMPPISPFVSSGSPNKSTVRQIGDKKYRALNRSFEEDVIKSSKVRAHQRLTQKLSDPTRKSTPQYSPIPVTVLGLELDDNMQEIKLQRVIQGPKKSVYQSYSDTESSSYLRTYPQRTRRSLSNPSFTDVTEACNNYIRKGKRFSKSLSTQDSRDDSTTPSPLLSSGQPTDNPRLNIPYTIQEGKSTSVILDLGQMNVRLSTEVSFISNSMYPNSKSLLPPSPAFSQKVETVAHDPVLSFHPEDVEGEAEHSTNGVHSNGVSKNQNDQVKLAVPNHLKLSRSKSILDKTTHFNIESSRVKTDQQEPISVRSNESNSYSSSISSMSTSPSPQSSFDIADPSSPTHLKKNQMTPAATRILERPVPMSPVKKSANHTTLVKTSVVKKNDVEKNLSSSEPVINRGASSLGQGKITVNRRPSDGDNNSQRVVRRLSNSGPMVLESVHKRESLISSQTPVSNNDSSNKITQVVSSKPLTANKQTVVSKPHAQVTVVQQQALPASTAPQAKTATTPKTVHLGTNQTNVTDNNKNTSVTTVNKPSNQPTTKVSEKKDAAISREKTEPTTRLLFSRLSNKEVSKTPATQSMNTPRSAGQPSKNNEPAKQCSMGNSSRKESAGKSPSQPTNRSAGTSLASKSVANQSSVKSGGKVTVAKSANTHMQDAAKSGQKYNGAIAETKASTDKKGTLTPQDTFTPRALAQLMQSDGNLRPAGAATLDSKSGAVTSEPAKHATVVKKAETKKDVESSQTKDVLAKSKESQINKCAKNTDEKLCLKDAQTKERKSSEKENIVDNGLKVSENHHAVKAECGGAAEGIVSMLLEKQEKIPVKEQQKEAPACSKDMTATKIDMVNTQTLKMDNNASKLRNDSQSSDSKLPVKSGGVENKFASKPKTEELLRKAAETLSPCSKNSAEVTPVIYDMMESNYMQKVANEKQEQVKLKVEVPESRENSAGKRAQLALPKNVSHQRRISSAKETTPGSANRKSSAKRACAQGSAQKSNQNPKTPASAGKVRKVSANKVPPKPTSGKNREKSAKVDKPKSAKGRSKPKSAKQNPDVVTKGRKESAQIISDEDVKSTAFITGQGWQIKTGRNETDDVIINKDLMMFDSSDSDMDMQSEDITPRIINNDNVIHDKMPETFDTIKEFADSIKGTAEDQYDSMNMSINDKIIHEIRRTIGSNTSSSKSARNKKTVPVLEAPAGDGGGELTPRCGFTDESDDASSFISDASYETNPDLMKVFCIPDQNSEVSSICSDDIEGCENMEDEVKFETDWLPDEAEVNVKENAEVKVTEDKKKVKCTSSNVTEKIQKEMGKNELQNKNSEKVKNTKTASAKKPQPKVPTSTPENKVTAQKSAESRRQGTVTQQPKPVTQQPKNVVLKEKPVDEIVKKKTSESLQKKSTSEAPIKLMTENAEKKSVSKPETNNTKVERATNEEVKQKVSVIKSSAESKKTDLKDVSTKVVQKPPLPKKDGSESRPMSEKTMNKSSINEQKVVKSTTAKNEPLQDNVDELGDDDVFGSDEVLSPEQHAAKLSAMNVEKLQTLLLSQTQEGGDHSPAVKLHKPSQKDFESIDSMNSLASEFFSNSLVQSEASDLSDRTLTDTIKSETRTITSSLGKRRSAASSIRSVCSTNSHADFDDQLIHWKKGHVLGRGAYGTVSCGLTNTGQLIAVKQVELSVRDKEDAEKQYEKLQEEVDLLKTLQHENIVGFLGTCLEDNVVNIFMQFVPGGSIAQLLARFGALEEPVFCRYTKQILKGVEYLHDNSVIHRDIKGGNVMLMPNGVIKLIDFGCAKRLCINLSQSQARLLKSMRGTPYWMAPEVVMETGHGTKSDIWSIGCTVFEMATRKPPWSEMAPMAAIFAIGSGDKPKPKLPERFSQEARDFVAACMQRDQDARLTAKELQSHPFILRKREKTSLSDPADGRITERKILREGNEFKEKKS